MYLCIVESCLDTWQVDGYSGFVRCPRADVICNDFVGRVRLAALEGPDPDPTTSTPEPRDDVTTSEATPTTSTFAQEST